MTATAKGKPRKRSLAKTVAVTVAVLLLAAIVTHKTLIAVLIAALAVAVAVLAARARCRRYFAGGRIAAWRRRRHQGPASWAELRRRAFKPGGIPICTVTRGRTR